jgi:phosphopantothenoylcysteine synthetase/decarboxylase
MSAAPPDRRERVLYLVVCAAPPVLHIGELVDLLQQQGWRVCVIPPPTAASWIDGDALGAQTGYPVRAELRGPREPSPLPAADAVVVAPATFNTINKWAAGTSDTFALGILNEALGLGLPVVASPYTKPALATHPAFRRSLATLREAGVRHTETEALCPANDGARFRWTTVVAALTEATSPEHRGIG